MIPVVFAASPGGTLVFCPPHMCNKLHGSNSSVRYPEVSAASNGSRNVSNDDGLELGSLTWRGKKEDSNEKPWLFPMFSFGMLCFVDDLELRQGERCLTPLQREAESKPFDVKLLE